MSAIILGDVHLGKGCSIGKTYIGSSVNSRILDQINLLDWTLDQSIENLTNNIIITGDIFEDPKPHPSLISLFISWLKKCESHHVNVYIIAGNHDVLRNGNIYTSPLDIINECEMEGIFVYNNINTIYIDHVAYTFLPFRDRKSLNCHSLDEAIEKINCSLQYELSSIPNTYKKVCVGHLAIIGSIFVGDEIDDLHNELFCPLEMFNGYDYVWMGHVHKPQVFTKNPHIAHVGSMDISDFGESDHKKELILIKPEEKSFYKTINIPTRSLNKIQITIPKDTENTTDFILSKIKNENLSNSIAKLEISYESNDLIPIDKSKIEKVLYQQGVFNIAGITQNKKVNIVKKPDSNLDLNMTINTAIKTYADKYIEESFKNDFIELCNEIYSSLKADQK